ncbi:MAG: HAD family hydrolase [Acidobacteriota bacterium]
MSNIGVFMDRDGTLSEEVGYINHLSRFSLFPWSVPAVRMLNEGGLKAIVVTNQAGVARGYFTEDLIHDVHRKMAQEMRVGGASLDAIYYCPHHPEVGKPPYRQACGCRKPQPGMVLRGAREFNLDLSRSYVIGDRYGDMELARNAGTRSILVLSGYGRGEYEYQRQNWKSQPDAVASNLLEAVQLILEWNRSGTPG